MANRFYTVLIVPERASRVRRLNVSRRLLVHVGLWVSFCLGVTNLFVVHCLYTFSAAAEQREMLSENQDLRRELAALTDQANQADQALDRLDLWNSKIQAVTQVSDSERNLAMGPLAGDAPIEQVGELQGAPLPEQAPLTFTDARQEARSLDAKFGSLASRASTDEQHLIELSEYVRSEKLLLRATPSIMPVPSQHFITSFFGIRHDPYSSARVMHKGLDIAGQPNSWILAPADGTVIWSDDRGGYGHCIIIDHGFGIQTHFAHLSSFRVHAGMKVHRGQLIGLMGTSGLSTGTHLHYEVRLNGIPLDPTKFILD